MMSLTRTILLLIIVSGINSCCTKKKCWGIDDLNQIWFYNFPEKDLDTIVIIRFEKSTGFAAPIDSFSTFSDYFSSTDPGDQTVYLSEFLSIEFDYQIKLISSGQIFTISEFAYKRQQCNTGFLCHDYYDKLSSYKVNGQLQTAGVLAIYN